VAVAHQLDIHPDFHSAAHRHEHQRARVREVEAQILARPQIALQPGRARIALRPGLTGFALQPGCTRPAAQAGLAVRPQLEAQLARVGIGVAGQQRAQDPARACPQGPPAPMHDPRGARPLACAQQLLELRRRRGEVHRPHVDRARERARAPALARA